MKFEWDERKNQSNFIKHGFDFADAYRIFNLPIVVELDERENYGEVRFVAIGLLDGRVVVIVYTEPDDQTIRIISV
ncbi:MAG: BrnT family toxin, partial [Microcystis sp.]